MQDRATLAAQVARMKEDGAGRLEPLVAFITDAQKAHYVAQNGNRRELRDFHRKIGSNLFMTGRINDVGSLRAPLLRRRTPRNPPRVSEPRRGGCAARAETENPVPAPSFASFFVFGDSPAPPVSVADLAQNPPAPLVESASPVLLADFPKPWRIVAETPKSRVVDGRGLEPLWIAPPAPKAGASANFATRPGVAGCIRGGSGGGFQAAFLGACFGVCRERGAGGSIPWFI